MSDNYFRSQELFFIISATYCSNLNAANSYFIMYKIEILKTPDGESKSYIPRGVYSGSRFVNIVNFLDFGR